MASKCKRSLRVSFHYDHFYINDFQLYDLAASDVFSFSGFANEVHWGCPRLQAGPKHLWHSFSVIFVSIEIAS